MQQQLNVNLINKSGFTLIEFCVAVLIMMVGLLGLLQSVNLATEHNLGTALRNEAVSVADEQIVLAKASVIDGVTFSALNPQSIYVNRKTRSGFGNYSVAWSPPTSASTSSKEISVRVSWRYKGNKLSHTISTLITNPAL